eukprot:CAMPEP_0173280304 /NCGR_PEP_ID=MMETSP1143-20121109/5611_1 /TAXON_ID=483371 /ORGANISM="non described non described, Strain CCMP2298" /LENGTH=265 /DNA_ID=CAMNT_0014217591 /DNA_START=359 /DNA_END=1156 /DNA_ORIENTATION=-
MVGLWSDRKYQVHRTSPVSAFGVSTGSTNNHVCKAVVVHVPCATDGEPEVVIHSSSLNDKACAAAAENEGSKHQFCESAGLPEDNENRSSRGSAFGVCQIRPHHHISIAVAVHVPCCADGIAELVTRRSSLDDEASGVAGSEARQVKVANPPALPKSTISTHNNIIEAVLVHVARAADGVAEGVQSLRSLQGQCLDVVRAEGRDVDVSGGDLRAPQREEGHECEEQERGSGVEHDSMGAGTRGDSDRGLERGLYVCKIGTLERQW